MVTQAEVKEILQDYVLIVYDIPASQKKLRFQFLKQARSIGAIGYTQSCYLLPLSNKSLELANELAAQGDAVVWQSYQHDKEKALVITTKYEQHLAARCDYIAQRLVIIQEHLQAGRLNVAKRMGIKTGKLLKELAQIAESFSPEWLTKRIEELVAQWKEVYSGV